MCDHEGATKLTTMHLEEEAVESADHAAAAVEHAGLHAAASVQHVGQQPRRDTHRPTRAGILHHLHSTSG